MSQTPTQQELVGALQQAAVVIQRQEQALAAYHGPIAIVGMGCHYPGESDTPERFWQNLLNGFDAIITLPATRAADLPMARTNAPAVAPGAPEKELAQYTRRGGFLAQVDHFDAAFFGLAPREVRLMDPAHRLLLEIAWQALEDANLLPGELFNRAVGVFMGSGASGYRDLCGEENRELYTATGNTPSTAAGRISYLFGLTGPCVAVDTACSSSLTAIHLACQSLRMGECTVALAGGVNLLLDEAVTAMFASGNLLAPDARCKSFDATANGYVRGEGCGIVVLKRLADAQANQDRIRAVIRGTAINQDGPSGGLTVPNGPAQVSVIRRALDDAHLKPAQISYLEAHGTGTPLGDPIEIGALQTVFKPRATPLYVGSVKTNIGHLEYAAGVAGLMKLVLALQHGLLPPNLHLQTPNPHIDWGATPVQVPTTVTPWPVAGDAQERIGGVSSFGFSGTNAHLIVAAAPTTETGKQLTERSTHLLTISAKSKQALQAYVQHYQTWLASQPTVTLGELCYTSHIGRSHFAHRLSITTASLAQLQHQLTTFGKGEPSVGVSQGLATGEQPLPAIAFLFTGQGSQYVGMGRELYETQPLFRSILERCEAALQAWLGCSLLERLYPATEPTYNDLLESQVWGQVANYALQCALTDLWRAWGVQPAFVLGHSLGDFAAAYAAGVFPLEDGLRLVAERGRLMAQAAGSMVAVLAAEAEVLPFLAPFADVTIAVINGAQSVVISGGQASVAQVTAAMQAAGFQTRKLTIPVAAHSPLLDPILDAFEGILRQVTLTAPRCPVISSMTGNLVTSELTDPRYWRQQLRNTVRFADSVQTLYAQGCTIFLEIGPKPTLVGMVELLLEGEAQQVILPSLRAGQSDWQQMLTSLGALYVHGVAIDWAGFDKDYQQRKVTLPTYPFQRQRFWVDPPPKRQPTALRPLIDKMTHLPLHKETVFETEFSVERLPFLADHRVYDRVISPGACQLALVLSAAEVTFGAQQALHLSDVILPQALVLPTAEGTVGARTVQVVLTPAAAHNGSGPGYDFTLISFAADSAPSDVASAPATHAIGHLTAPPSQKPATIALAVLQQACTEPLDLPTYDALAMASQIVLGPNFQWLVAAWRRSADGPGAVLVKVAMPAAVGSVQGHSLHPGLLDACFQAAGLTTLPDANGETHLPFALATLQLHQPITGTEWWCYAVQTEQRKWDLQLLDEAGGLLLTITGFEVRSATAEAVRGKAAWRDWLYQVEWQTRPYFGLLPDYLPGPASLLPALQETAQIRWEEQADEAYQALLDALETLSIDYVLAAFAKVGFRFQVGSTWRSEQIARQLGVIPAYRRLLHRLLAILAEAGVLQPEAEQWRVLQAPALVNPAVRVATLQTTYGYQPALRLLARCGEKVSEVWRGVQEPLELLFPGGDASEVMHLYSESPAAQVMNRLVQQVVQTSVSHLPAGRGLRIVEIGAGTGGTTAGVLPLLPAAQSEYYFTDIGASFLHQAQARFAAYDFVRYHPLDIEQAPKAQGFAPQGTDLVIAANVLHATQDLRTTLRHVRQLLQPGGTFVLVESVSPSRLVDLTFGLTDGWWRFADERQTHPLVSTAAWQTLLLANGFQAVEVVEQAGQAVFVAQAGLRQAQPPLVETVVEPVVKPVETWLLFADRQGIGHALAQQLCQRGERALLVYADASYRQVDGQTVHIRPDCAEDYQRLLQTFSGIQGIVHLWSLNTPSLYVGMNLVEATQPSCGAVLHLVQALLQTGVKPSHFWLVTQDAQAVTASDMVQGVVHASLWGMGKVIALEHPELNCRCIDLDATATPVVQAERLCAEMTADSTPEARESQIALRQDARYVARLTRYPTQPGLAMPAAPYRLEITERGSLDNLQLRPVERRAPAPDEIEIQVQASGLNFRDLLNVLGLYPGDPGPLGGECSGIVVAVGAAVTRFAVGDAVLALAAGSFGHYVTVRADFVMPKPPRLSAAEAATIPVAYVTAYYGLHQLAQMKAGDRVLIHAASGGVGMAAVHLAQLIGAQVFATASPGKWQTLRERGITHLYHSRTHDFAQQLMADTKGQGVDIILNSLTGPGFIEANLAALAQGGSLVEMSKRDVWSAEQVAAQRADVRYTRFDLGDVMLQQPALLQTMFATVTTLLAEQQLKPLPYTVFPIQQAIHAFRHMQQAKHIGKIVVTLPTAQASAIQAEATYLITGGLGGVGMAVAQWLVNAGARHLVLVGRRHPTTAVQAQLDEMADKGVTVTVAQVDVTNLAELATVLRHIDQRYPLRGVIHSVGVLEDGVLLHQSWARFVKVLAPKLQGAWHLHELTKAIPLDFFVLFSSAAGLLGNHGQANHAAANAFLDAFVHYRQAQGLPALSINWGAWSEIGEAAEMGQNHRHRMTAGGMGFIAPQQGIATLAYLLKEQAVQVGVLPIGWPAFLANAPTPHLFYANFSQPADEPAIATPIQAISLRQQLAATEASARDQLLLQTLQRAVANVLGLRNPEQVDPCQGLLEMGLDSLMAIELRNHLTHIVEQPLPATLIFDYPTLMGLNRYLQQDVFKFATGDADAFQQTTQKAEIDNATVLGNLSDAELDAVIEQELALVAD